MYKLILSGLLLLFVVGCDQGLMTNEIINLVVEEENVNDEENIQVKVTVNRNIDFDQLELLLNAFAEDGIVPPINQIIEIPLTNDDFIGAIDFEANSVLGVSLGFTKEQVKALLGEPDSTGGSIDESATSWNYEDLELIVWFPNYGDLAVQIDVDGTSPLKTTDGFGIGSLWEDLSYEFDECSDLTLSGDNTYRVVCGRWHFFLVGFPDLGVPYKVSRIVFF